MSDTVRCQCGREIRKFGQPNCFECGRRPNKCDVCREAIGFDEEHFPHDKDCPLVTRADELDELLKEIRKMREIQCRSKDQEAQLKELIEKFYEFDCDCDNVTCEACCWECEGLGVKN